jgi:uncharacterized protein (TIGR03437 family)
MQPGGEGDQKEACVAPATQRKLFRRIGRVFFMKNALCGLVLSCLPLLGQPAETVVYRALLSTQNEVPPVNLSAAGTSTVWVHVVRDEAGQVISGSVDFVTRYAFPGAVTLTGMHIHRGVAGANGPVVIDSAMTRTEDGSGTGMLRFQGQVLPTNTAGLTALRDLLVNPQGYYVNLHSTDHPAGAIRGQLQPARRTVLMTQLSPANEVPAVTGLNASGAATVMLLTTASADGTITSGEAIFDANYTGFPEGTLFTGFHIHAGRAGNNGPIVINTGMSGQVPAVANGEGNLRYEAEVPMTAANAVSALNGLLSAPQNYYLNLHTTANPGGAVRGQMRNTEAVTFSRTLLPSNEVPPLTGLDASAAAAFSLHVMRDEAGRVVAAGSVFDVNHRFPGETQFTGLHVHDGLAGANGPVSIDSGLNRANTPLSASGFGNIYRIGTQIRANALNSINNLLRNPENHYLNLHTSVNTGGAVRAQVAAESTAAPRLLDVLSSVSDASRRTVAPQGLFTIFGSDLTKAVSSGGGAASYLPFEVNGVIVNIAGRFAPILAIGREPQFTPSDYIVAQVPVDTPAGTQSVKVTTAAGESNTLSIQVAAVAPAAYFDASAGIAFLPDGTLVRPDKPAAAGQTIHLMVTGLGQTAPAMETGQRVPEGITAVPVMAPSVTIGGQTATVSSAVAAVGMNGIYLISCVVPQGISGDVEVVIRAGGSVSNAVRIPVR